MRDRIWQHKDKKVWLQKRGVTEQVACALGSGNDIRCKIACIASGIEPQTSNPVRQGSKVTLENLFCLTQVRVGSHPGSAALQMCLVTSVLPLLLSQDSPAKCCHFAYLFIYLSRVFVPTKKRREGGGYFSGATLMRPSPRFHGDSHKTVKFPVFQKKKTLSGGGGGGGCSSTVRGSFSKSMSFLLEGETFLLFFPEFSQFASLKKTTKKTATLAVSKNTSTTTEYMKSHKYLSCIVFISYFWSSLKHQEIRNLYRYLLTSLLEGRSGPLSPPSGPRASKWDCY